MDGHKLRDEIVAGIRTQIDDLGNPGVCLATVLVGSDKPSQIYVRNKHRKAEEAGMVSRHVELAEDATKADVEDAVRALADDVDVHGILVPLKSSDTVLDAMRHGKVLRIASDQTEFSFQLTGTRDAIAALTQCVTAHQGTNRVQL